MKRFERLFVFLVLTGLAAAPAIAAETGKARLGMEDHWGLFLFIAGLIAAWSLVILGVQKAMSANSFKVLGEKIEEIRKVADRTEGFEKKLLELKADLPLNYVRKEDFIRHEVVINTKLDRLRDLLEDMKERKNAR